MDTQFINQTFIIQTFLLSFIMISCVTAFYIRTKQTLTNHINTFGENIGHVMGVSDLSKKNMRKGEISGSKKSREFIAKKNLQFLFSSVLESKPAIQMIATGAHKLGVTETNLLGHVDELINEYPSQLEQWVAYDLRTGKGLLSSLLPSGNALAPNPDPNQEESPEIPPEIGNFLSTFTDKL